MSSMSSIARSFFEALARGDIDLVRSALADDFRWTVQGSTLPIARTYTSVHSVFDEYLPEFGAYIEPGSAQIAILDVIGDDDREVALVEYRETATSRSGRPLRLDIAAVVEIEHERITRVREYYDMSALLTV